MSNKSTRSMYSFIAPLRKRSLALGVCGVTLTAALFFALLFYLRMPAQGADDNTYGFIAAGLLLFIFLILLIVLIAIQEKINSVFSSLIVVLEYNSRYLYRFYRQQAAHTFPLASIILLGSCIASSVIGFVMGTTPAMVSIASIMYLLAALLFIISILALPSVVVRLNYLVCLMLGRDKHIVLSRRGVLTSRHLLNFGLSTHTTLFRAEKRHVGSFDCITLYYHKRRGYSVEPAAFDIPLPQDTDPSMINELLNIYNSSDLFMKDRPSYMM